MVEFNDKDLLRYVARKKFAPGCHAVISMAAERHVSDKNPNNLMAKFTSKILKDPDDISSVVGVPLQEWITFPIPNPDVEGHEDPDYSAQMCANFLNGMLGDEVPRFPYRDPVTGALMYAGDVIDADQALACKLDAVKKCKTKAVEIWGEQGEGVTSLVEIVSFVKVDYPKEDGLPRVVERHLECPEDWELSETYTVSEKLSGMDDLPDANTPVASSRKKKTRGRRGK